MSRRRDSLSGLAMAARLRDLQEAAAETAAGQARIADGAARQVLQAAEEEERTALDGWRAMVGAPRLDLERLAGWSALVDRQVAATAEAARERDACAARLGTARDAWSAARAKTTLAEQRLAQAKRELVRRSEEAAISDAAELHLLLGRRPHNAH